MTNKQDIAEDIQIEATRGPNCQFTAKVTLGPIAAAKAHKEAFAAVRKSVSLPGFRKGRAPEKLVASHFGPQIEREFRTRSLSLAMLGIMDKEKVSPLDRNRVNGQVESLSQEQVTCSISFELQPEVPLLSSSEISIEPVTKEEVTDEKVAENLEETRRERGEWKPIEPRAITEGDHVVLDIVALGDADSEEEQEPRPVCEDHRFLVKEGEIGQWLINILLDKKPGEVVEGISERDDTLPEDAPFVPTRYRITIKEIVESEPLSDEALAKTFEKETLEEAREELRRSLEARSEGDVYHETKKLIAEHLIANHSFDLPGSTIEGLRQTGIKREIRARQAEGATGDQIKEQSEEIENVVREMIVSRLTLFFLADKFFRENDPSQLEIESNDLRTAYFREMLVPLESRSLIDKEMSPEESRMELIIQIYTERLLNRLATEIMA